jgi:biopolymer transport protein TolR
MARRGEAFSQINVTSLVDVSLVLLIIFMMTAPFIQAGVEIDLPEADDAGLDVREGMVLSIDPDRTVWIGDDAIPAGNLQRELKRRYEEDPGRSLYLRADQTVPYGFVVQVIAVAKNAGFVNLGLVTLPSRGDLLGAAQ